MRIGHSDWSKAQLITLYITALGGEYNISELYLTRHPCNLGQVNMAGSC